MISTNAVKLRLPTSMRIHPVVNVSQIVLSQIRYSLVVILELNGVSEVQYKDVMIIDDGKYQ